MAHTPGPWHRLSGGVISNCVGADWSSSRHFVARIDCDNEDDARLIAAAPDLLAALEEITPAQYGCGRHTFITEPDCTYCQRAERARAAIAKARGTA